MIKRLSSACILVLLSCVLLTAQDNDPVLFTVDKVPVRVSEFDYIYSKTNAEKADYSKTSLEEYLDLYTKFKLKVKKAKDLQLDTIQELKKELQGYRRQLADSYLINKEVTEMLVKEAYERKKQDVELNHIFFKLAPNAKPADTLAAYQKAMNVKRELREGTSFETLAKKYSDDRSAQTNGGRIGYINALFPKGFYAIETAAYTQKLGSVTGPLRTPQGYHLIKVSNRRPARGAVEAAHILLRTERKLKVNVKARIDSIYNVLLTGGNFESLARQLSEDERTASKGGYIGSITINRFEEVFEDNVFAVEKDNSFGKPFESSLGFHIVKRISKNVLKSYEEEKAAIEGLVKKDDRFEASKVALIESIKRNGKFQEFPLVLERFIQTQNDTFFTFRWKAPKTGMDQVLFNLADEKITLGEFGEYLSKSTRQRMRLNSRSTVSQGVRDLYKAFVDDTCLRLEEAKLEEKYPDFKALMREYEEGILLFEVTKRNVWDKAAQDTSGLKTFHKTIKDKYKWNERAEVTTYTLNKRDRAILDAMREYATNHTVDEVRAKFKLDDMETSKSTVEKDKSTDALNIKEWKAGYVTLAMMDSEKETFSFMKVESILPARSKDLNEARGYIIADYQDYLEKQWVEELRKEYKVQINQKTFNKLVK